MVNFGPEATQAPDLRSAQTPQEGVGSFDATPHILGSIFEGIGTLKSSSNDRLVADFTRRQLLEADAVAQGKRESPAARSRMRKNLIDAISSNPKLATEFIKAQASIVGLAGAAGIVEKGDLEEQRRESRKSQLVTAGVLSWDADDTEFDLVDQVQRQAVAAEERYQERTRTIDLALKNEQLSSAKRARLEDEKKVELKRYLEGIAGAEFQGMKGVFNNILNDDTLSETDKQQQIQEVYTDFKNKISTQLGDATSQQSAHLLAPFEMLFEHTIQNAKGELSDQELARSTERILAIQQKLLLTDPAAARAVAVSKLLGDTQLAQVLYNSNQQVFDSVVRFMAGHTTNPFSENSVEQKALKISVESILRNLESSSPEHKRQAVEDLDRFIKTLDLNEGTLRDNPLTGQATVELLAHPDFLKAVKSNPETTNNLELAADVIERHYADEVWGMVKREFRENNIVSATPFPMGVEDPKQGEVTPTPDAVGFKATAGGMEFFALDAESKDARRKARILNKDLKPIINTTIKALSHLEGHSNYSSMWEKISQDVITGGAGDKAVAGDAGDDLLLSSFTNNTSLPAETNQLVGYLDATETGTGSYDTLLGHTQNSLFSGVKASQMTINQVRQFQKSSEYRNYSKQQVGRVATPVGRYQIVGTTLDNLVEEMSLSGNEMFDDEMQDRMFAFLLQRRLRRANGDLSKAVKEVRSEWEGLRKISTTKLKTVLKDLL